MKIALAQINPTVGDFDGNSRKILEFAARAAEGGAELVLFPELSVCGYPPADLLEKPAFLTRAGQVVEEIATKTAGLGIAVVVGYPTPAPHGSGKHVSNSAALLRNGHIEFVQTKMLLPFYDVFDEQRYFAPAEKQRLFCFEGQDIALTICEDAWNDKSFWENRLYKVDPIDELMRAGGRLILNISSSPYWQGKRETRRRMLSAIAKRHKAPVLLVNQVGGNDSLVFDGSSLAIGPDGELIAQAKSFEEDLLFVDLSAPHAQPAPISENEHEAIYKALVLGTRDYVGKCGFSKAIIGLSGGIDSALVAAIAVDALGAENVLTIGMPSPYSSQGSIDDSRRLAANLGIRYEVLGISQLFEDFQQTLAPMFAGLKPDITEENIQSRIRGNLLMALSNKFNALVLTTGNKSEMSTGYCTLYGDMVGALAVIGDVVKTEVYELCRWINRNGEVIPWAILEKPPSAELRPDQKDTDSLPPYEVLDPILEAYVERYETAEAIAASQHVDLELVRRVVKLVERSEYKRQQAAPVLKVTSKAFGMGRRFPIAVKVQV
ncbi:NAD+ synthase [Silvibacterium dinghuense]|uniref:Glutamine-dependent NAD(+) synthetase n=1 Tax=Silvibacterium dinghuense TaxID=1560006 RepID=A0A4V1NVN3_9BACT|nr:NAD+ synthase [Silvibacterium dinghuense]RXS96522.1 NAD+ synthase [Silvibacterium dinghuense]GGG91514.1 NAD+ synthase [Silvibacterium dinghuense]